MFCQECSKDDAKEEVLALKPRPKQRPAKQAEGCSKDDAKEEVAFKPHPKPRPKPRPGKQAEGCSKDDAGGGAGPQAAAEATARQASRRML